MAVYVDPPLRRFGRMIMCHCWADQREDLFAMMDRIGVDRKWFQRPPGTALPGEDCDWEHFDISKSKRALAVKYGAIETDRYGPLEHVARLNGNAWALETIAKLRAWRREGEKV